VFDFSYSTITPEPSRIFERKDDIIDCHAIPRWVVGFSRHNSLWVKSWIFFMRDWGCAKTAIF
jgi:hypothetical protein